MIAAESQRDGDSLFNAGYCLLHGRGVPQNYRFARELFSIAANKFGHFDSVFTLGSMMIEGTGGLRSTTSSLRYLKAAYSIGSYHAWIRRGLDAYLNGHYEKSAMCYLRASEIGDASRYHHDMHL
jgi:TPR repeat protein